VPPTSKHDRWLRKTPMGKLYTWLTSVPGSLLFNPPAYKMHEELQLRPGNRVLDIGCGRGSMLQLLASHIAFEKPPVGIDTSRALLRLGQRDGAMELLQASSTDLPLANGSFDVVTCAYATHMLESDGLLHFMRELRRVLSPGGIAVVWDFSPTRSRALNRFHERVLEMSIAAPTLRNYTEISSYALEAGFEWVSNAHLRPFFFPPIPRASVICGKVPIGWKDGQPEGLTPDTHAQTLVAGVTEVDTP
jgi:SAM-dependent methyltransferase